MRGHVLVAVLSFQSLFTINRILYPAAPVVPEAAEFSNTVCILPTLRLLIVRHSHDCILA